MGNYKTPLHSTIAIEVMEAIKRIQGERYADEHVITSRSKIVEELLRIGIKEYDKRQKKSET